MLKKLVLLILFINMTSLFGVTKQGHFKWRNDDGSEAAATTITDVGGNIEVVEGSGNIRIRIECYYDEDSGGWTNGETPITSEIGLYYTSNTSYDLFNNSHWTLVEAGSGGLDFYQSLTDNYADGASSLDLLANSVGGDHDEGYKYEMHNSETHSWSEYESKEFEFCIKPTANATAGETFYFCLRNPSEHDPYNDPLAGEINNPYPLSLPSITIVGAPIVTTNAAGSITSTGATLNGTVNANDASTVVTFQYGLSDSYGTSVTATESPITGSTNTSVSKAITGLSPGTTYHYRVVGVNTGGTSNGLDATFSTLNAVITFTDGSSFTPSITPGNTDQALGCIHLAGDVSGSTLSSSVIKLIGTRTGLSNLKLWESADAAFGSDTQLGSTVVVDPGDGNTVTFGGLSGSISTGGKYYFLSGDIASGATGTVVGVIVENNSLTISNGTISATINNAPMSDGNAPLPVELNTFTASVTDGGVKLNWTTGTEVNNYGFNVECTIDNVQWETKGFVRGSGNSNSPKQYSFTDLDLPDVDQVKYRLKQIDNDGTFAYSKTIDVDLTNITGVKEVEIPVVYSLSQNYPNPFNPTTTIKFSIPSTVISNGVRNLKDFSSQAPRNDHAHVTLIIYDILGREIKTLVNQKLKPGNHEVNFDASDLPSGMYVYKIAVDGQFSSVKKMLLIK